jgi:hypothetical protein
MAFTPLIAKIVELLLDGEWTEPNLVNKTGHAGLNIGKFNPVLALLTPYR